MAKGSNNIRGRTSDASKPYDVSNSFVKRVASRMTELLPQPSSWLSRWMSPASASNVNDYTSHSLSSTITSRPPATSRAELNLVDNVDHHIPAKKPRTNRYNSPVNQNKRIRSEVYSPEDISPIAVRGEPVAGPSSSSGHQEFIASTPAVHVPQRLIKVNGDDCSETSESTSGCSSLVPQAQSSARSLGGSRYGRTLPPGTNMDSLHRRRPSFSTTTFTSPLRASMRERLGSSPFYSGRTMYGGSSQAYLSTVYSPQRRVGPTVKPMPSQQSLPLSSTAKRILDALEQFSTPVMDAKRMPVAVGSKRKLESSNQRYIELSVPSTPDLLRVKRRERLQQSTAAARQTASVSVPTPQSPSEYIIRKDDADKKKHTGKVKKKDKFSDEALVEVKLPTAVLPVDNLPKIDIAIPPPPPVLSTATSQSFKTNTSKYVFSVPATVSYSESDVSPANILTSSFKFSAPIGELSVISDDINKQSLSSSTTLPMTSSDVKNNQKRRQSKDEISPEPLVSPASDCTANAKILNSTNTSVSNVPSSSSSVNTAQLGDKLQNSKSHLPKSDSTSIPCPTSLKKQDKNRNTNDKIVDGNQWEFSTCKNGNPLTSNDSVSCQTKKQAKSIESTKNNVIPQNISGFGHLYKKPVGTWECSTCMIQNKNEATKCIACETAKPAAKEIINASGAKTSLDSNFKKPSALWESQITKTAANTSAISSSSSSESSKTSITDTKMSGNGFGNMFQKPAGSWNCETCMVQNDKEKIKCVACDTVKPGATLPKTMESSTPKFAFGMPTSVDSSSLDTSTTFSFGIPKESPSVSAQSESSLATKTNVNTNSSQFQAPISTATFSFGIPKTTKAENDINSNVTSKSMFQFGSTQINTPDSKLSTGNTSTNKQNISGNINKNVIPVKIKEAVSIESTKPVLSKAIDTVSTTAATPSTSIKSVTPTFGIKNEKPVAVNTASPFAFGTNKITPSNSEKLNEATSSSNSLQPGFMFGAKQDSFGSNVMSSTTSTISTSTPANVFKFGDTKTVSSVGDKHSISSVSCQSSFTTAKPNNSFSFGSNNEKKEISFLTPSIKETPTSAVNMSVTENKPTFGPFGSQSNLTSTSFGNTNVFGSGSFGNKDQAQSLFVPPTTSSVFGTTETTSTTSTSSFSGFASNAFQTAAQENKPSAVFSFGSAPSKESATTGGFVFNPVTDKRPETSFGFSSTQPSSSGPVFGFNAASSTPSATFNFEPKPFGSGISPFNTANDAAPVFGTTTSQQPTPVFGEQANPNPVFAFGSQPAQQSQTSTNAMFEFSQQQNTSIAPAPSTTFVFGATTPATPSAPAFDPNVKPTFNFSQGSTPVFSAIPTVNPTATPQPQNRKIRKAIRRTNISSVRQT